MNKNIKYRTSYIEEYLSDGKFATTKELADELDVSITTVQRDLIRMEKEGNIERAHGGVMITKRLDVFPSLFSRVCQKTYEKEKISYKAAGLLKEYDSIFVETGSTCLSMYEKINVPHITVFTNSLLISMKDNQNCNVFVIEGRIDKENLGIYGDFAIENLDRINPNKIFFSCVGIDANGKVLCFRDYDRGIINKLGKMNGQKIILIDSSKFGAQGAFTAISIDCVDTIITDSGISDYYKQMINDLGVNLLIV